MAGPKKIKASDLTESFISEYSPAGYAGLFYMGRNRPPFTHWTIREMMTDPRIKFGLSLIKGPIASMARFEIQSENTEVAEFISAQINRFWKNSLMRALKALEWGFSGSECVYRIHDGKLQFDRLKDIDPLDVRPVTLKGKLVGVTVRNVPAGGEEYRHAPTYIGVPKAFWHVHQREYNPWFGLSRLYSAHIPWWEIWSDGGYRDVRRLWFYKNSFEGGVIYHPPGQSRLPNGMLVTNKDLARELVEKKRTGGTLTLPNTNAAEKQRAWEYEAPKANPAPGDLMEYGDDLRREILEALGIPPEVIESESSEGFGSSSGRQIPTLAFFSTLQELVQWLIYDLDEQILSFLVKVNYGPVEYEILAKPLVDSVSEAMGSKETPQEMEAEQQEDAPPDSSGKEKKPKSNNLSSQDSKPKTNGQPAKQELPKVAKPSK